jgi:hypothetical protein
MNKTNISDSDTQNKNIEHPDNNTQRININIFQNFCHSLINGICAQYAGIASNAINTYAVNMFCTLKVLKSAAFFDNIESIKSIKNEVTNVSQNQNKVKINQTISNL